MAGIVVMLIVGNAVEAVVEPEVPSVVGAVYLAVFLVLLLVMFYTAHALLVRGLINFQVAFWTRLAAALRSRRIADSVTRIAPPARKIGDIFILMAWTLWTFVAAIAVPAMIGDTF